MKSSYEINFGIKKGRTLYKNKIRRNRYYFRFNTLSFDPITVDIIEQVNQFSTAEKEILLKHLKLSNAIKSGETTTV